MWRHLPPLVGRSAELASLRAALRERNPPLLTLTGPGGCGKTRLALALAELQALAAPDGVAVVELAALSDPALVPATVASAVGLRQQSERPPREALVDHLAAQRLLLVLDNCEHLLEACADLAARVVRGCPNVRLLATSRAALGTGGELVWQVPPLPEPDAVRLFVDRATSARRTFSLGADNADAVSDVCRRLDGLPLAIELAAARINVLSVHELIERLADRRLMLASDKASVPARQRTLEATIAWSYDLLDEAEQRVLRAVSIFSGGWSVDAAEAVCGAGALDILGRLAARSLVVVEESVGHARHRLLETVRAFCRARVLEAGEEESLRRRHADVFAELAAHAADGLQDAEPVHWVLRLDQEQQNLRAALESLLRDRPDAAVRMTGDLWWYWFRAGLWHEGRRWLDRALAASTTPGAARARALLGLGTLAWAQGDHAEAQTRLEAAVALARDSAQPTDLGLALMFLSMEWLGRNDLAQARTAGSEATAILRESTSPVALGLALASFGVVDLAAEDFRRARMHLEESVALLRAARDGWGLALPLRNLGIVAFHQGDLEGAAALLRESLATLEDKRDHWFVSRGLETLAAVTAAQREFARAARLFGAGEALRLSVGAAVLPFYERDYDRGVAATRAALGETAAAQGWAAGRAMRLDDALAFALLGAPTPSPLSAREREVLALLARGLSNRAIAGALVVTEKTAEAHVSSILRKLHLASRAQAAVWAVEHRGRDSGFPQ